MPILRHSDDAVNILQSRLVLLHCRRKTRRIQVSLVTPISYNTMPTWLEACLAPYIHRFALDSWCPNPWEALRRLSFVEWRDRWGTAKDAEGHELFVSGVLPEDALYSVVHAAETLGVRSVHCVGLDDTHRMLLAPKDVWA